MTKLRLTGTILVMCLIAQNGLAQGPTPRGEANATEAKALLIRELLDMFAVDREMRLRFLALHKDASDEERRRLDEVWKTDYEPVDQKHVARLKVLLGGRGWFAKSEVGAQASGGALTIVNHADDLPFQKEALAKIEALAPSERPEGYPNLRDRVAVAEGRPQRYGTQGTDCHDGQYVAPAAIEDPANLDVRRKEAGLPSMADYLATLQKIYGRC